MPRFHTSHSLRARDVHAQRVVCDGCDAPRAPEEHCREPALWLITEGAFEVRDRRGRRVADPSRALMFAADDPFTIRHPAGADVCVALRGPVVTELAARGTRSIPLAPHAHAHIASAIRTGDGLAIAEAVATLALDGRSSAAAGNTPEWECGGGDEPPARPHRDRELAAALADALRLSFAEPTSLAELAAATGASMFHACRVFRRVTGATLHGFRRELRLRHALAMLIDGDAPLAEIAAATGFASQSHLTNLFRAQFRTTPGKVRAARALSS